MSTDVSATRGGPLDNGSALARLARKLPADDVDPAAVREEMARIVRIQQERLLMDRLARKLVANVSVVIFDDSLRDSWKRYRRQRP